MMNPYNAYNDNRLILPPRYNDKDFNNYITNEYNERLVNHCKEFIKTKEGKSIVLFGNVGNGKTHLAVSMLKNYGPFKVYHKYTNREGLISEKESIIEAEKIFIVADEYFQRLNDAVHKNESKLEYINKYASKDLICLDDLSFRNYTEAKRENLFLLINKIYDSKKRFILTTNASISELKSKDEKIYSRLCEMADFLKFTLTDYREIKKVAKK